MFLKEDYSAHLCCFLIGLIKVLVWLVITGTQWLIMILIIINVDFFPASYLCGNCDIFTFFDYLMKRKFKKKSSFFLILFLNTLDQVNVS